MPWWSCIMIRGSFPLKLLHFGDAVNVTLGLPIIRTSVDHGTAYDLAGTGLADPGSLKAALHLAAQMAHSQSGRSLKKLSTISIKGKNMSLPRKNLVSLAAFLLILTPVTLLAREGETTTPAPQAHITSEGSVKAYPDVALS